MFIFQEWIIMTVTMQKNYYTVCKSSLENLPYFLMQKNGLAENTDSAKGHKRDN